MQSLREMAITRGSIPDDALALMGFQRTRQISATARQAWETGDRDSLLEEVRTRGDEIFRGTLAEVFTEYLPLRKTLSDIGRVPRHVIDIGCGQALNDAFLVKDYGCKVTLVDIEETPEQYHAWNEEGSGYASLTAARDFLKENGASEVVTLNPLREPEKLRDLEGDLVTSLISCGFHYPVGDYLDLFLETLKGGGAVILDLRRHYLRNPDDALATLLRESRQTPIIGYESKADRIMFQA